MHEILRDPVWQFIGALLALLTIGVTIWIYWVQKTQRRLLVERVARVPLITVGPNRIPGLQITMDGHTIEKATVLLIRVRNIGNAPLPASDFDKPISLEFAEEARVLNAQIESTVPQHLPIEVTVSNNEVEFSKNLLNPGDSYNCRVLVQNSSGAYAAKARITGVREIETSQRIHIGRSIAIVVSLLLLVVAAVLTPKPMSSDVFEIRSDEIPYLLLLIISSVVMAIAAIGDIKSRLGDLRQRVSLLENDDA